MEEPKDKTLSSAVSGPDFLLQWGNRKRLRCVKMRDGSPSRVAARPGSTRRPASRANRRGLSDATAMATPSPRRRPNLLRHRKLDSARTKRRRISMSPSPEKDRFYTTRGSIPEENGEFFKFSEERNSSVVLPRFFISLSNKEKEEDFMAMKGCKLPQRPKKRPKLLQKCLLLVSPGAWLSDLTQERYEVREKKSSKKRRGLKAMCLESDSE